MTRTYDIINAGPRNRFMANGRIVSNSARGIQVHNLARDTLPYEIDAIDALVAGMPADDFAALGDDAPISRKLSLLIRPALVAGSGKAFAWGDWANIEARITPWLANDAEAEKRLDIFRAVDADPSIPDIYTRTAAEVSGLPVSAIDKKLRQRGKVVDLAAQFGGGVNALLSMAASFRMHLADEEARAAVDRWREANPWAQKFWGRHDHHNSYGLWGAANSALETPGVAYDAGRITYIFLKDYLGGSLLCRLPSGRFLTYRRIKWERVDEIDEDTDEIISSKMELMFSRDMGRLKLWPGLLCENVTQAVAADLLRGTLVRLVEPDFDWMPTVLHTHDEIVVECAEADARIAARELVAEMEYGFDWTEGLPIKADAIIGRWYSKCESSWGL
jgi:DNA polymerase bacteriophage-type